MPSENQLKKNLKIIKIAIIAIASLFFIWIFFKTFWQKDEFWQAYNFTPGNTTRISALEPWYRLTSLQKENDITFQEVKAKLIYFTIAIPLNYSDIEINVKWQGNISQFEIGLEKVKDQFERKSASTKKINNWQESSQKFKVREFYVSNYLFKNNKVKAVLSFPDLKEDEMIKMREIKVIFKKSSPQKEEFFNFLRRVKNKMTRRTSS